jgi:uncharacterized protein (TIGR03437 family)
MLNLLRMALATTLTVATAAATVTCGQTIVANTTLDADVSCPADAPYGIVIGASNITLDLGGHVLSGYAPVGPPTIGVLVLNVSGVTVRNGSIEEFGQGITISGASGVTAANLSIGNLLITDPNHFISGMAIDSSTGVVVRDSQFQFAPLVWHKEAVDTGRSYVTVSNIQVTGGGVGVNFGFATTCDPANSARGEVLNSKFVEPNIAGVLVECTSGVRVAGNDFELGQGPGNGVGAYGPFFGAVSGLRVEGNTMRGGNWGIDYQGTTQSSATNNTISGSQIAGITVMQSLGEDGEPISYPAGNAISGNLTWGSTIDLEDDESGQGNTWTGNVCATKQGGSIPACSALAIVANPSNQSVAAGTAASFSASATYAGWLPPGSTQSPPMAAVQWQVSTNGGSTWANATGATSSAYSFIAAAADSGKQYRAVFSNGNGTATTSAATLTVSAASSGPAVTTQPSSQTVPAGQTATFSAAASGIPTPAAQWQVSTDGGATWVNVVTMAASPAYSFTAAATDNGKQYRAVFTNSVGTATTNAATLTVSALPWGPVVTTQPSNQSVAPGQTATFSAVASGMPAPTVQWQMSVNGGSTWTDASGATLPWYGFTAAAADSGKQVRAVFTNSAGTATTNAATLTVSATASGVTCGQTITANTTLNADLSCPSDAEYALAIGAGVFGPSLGASNITLDLGGHVLSGSGLGVVADFVNGVTIKNGTIEGFSTGVSIQNASNVTLENLSVVNLQSTDPAQAIVGISIDSSTGVVVRDSQFAFASMVFGKDAVDVYGSSVAIDNIVATGGGVGVDFNGTCNPVQSPSSGEVLNSRFVESRMAGVFVHCINGVRIAGNDFELPQGLGVGILTGPPSSGAVTGLQVDDNTINGGYQGIDYQGVTESSAANNTVSGATGWGIGLTQAPNPQGEASFPPTGNAISGNRAWGSGTDLYDDGSGQGNTWTGNVCATKQGAGIAACSALAIVTNPSDRRVVAGTAASFSAAATYAGWLPPGATQSPPMATVQWQVSANGGSTWANATGAASPAYSFTTALADSGKQFRAVFTNGNGTATTTAAALTVSTSSSGPAVTAQPSSQTVQAGQGATFSAAANGTPTPAVQWQVSADGGTTWVNLVAMASSQAYSLTAAATDNGKQYRAVFTNSVGTATTNAAALTVPGIGAVANAASFQPGISPGAWISIFGAGLASTTRGWRSDEIVSGKLPTELDGVSVTIDGKPAAICYISPTQLNVQVPDDGTVGPVPIQVTAPQGTFTATAQMRQVSPGLFTFDGKYVASQHADYSYVGQPNLLPGAPTTPAVLGEAIILWGTGFGPSNPPTPAGQLVTQSLALANAVTVLIGGTEAQVEWAGISGAGLYQINVLVPTSISAGEFPVVATVGGVSTQVNAMITILGH